MKKYDKSVEINLNSNWSYIPDHPYKILIIGGGQDKCVTELNETSTTDIDKIYLYVKDLCKSKYQLLIDGREKVGIEKLKNQKHS